MAHIRRSECNSPHCSKKRLSETSHSFPCLSFGNVSEKDWIFPIHVKTKVAHWFVEESTTRCGKNVSPETPEEHFYIDEKQDYRVRTKRVCTKTTTTDRKIKNNNSNKTVM